MSSSNFDFKKSLRESIKYRDRIKNEADMAGSARAGASRARGWVDNLLGGDRSPSADTTSAEGTVDSDSGEKNLDTMYTGLTQDIEKVKNKKTSSRRDKRNADKALKALKTAYALKDSGRVSEEDIKGMINAVKVELDRSNSTESDDTESDDTESDDTESESPEESKPPVAPDGSEIDLTDELTAKYMKQGALGGASKIARIKVLDQRGMGMHLQDIENMLNYDPQTPGKRSGRMYQAQDGIWYVITGLDSGGLKGYPWVDDNIKKHKRMHALISKVTNDLKSGSLKESSDEELEIKVNEIMQKVSEKINENNK